MRKVESAGRRRIRWTLTTQLEDLDFADDICLTPHRLSDTQGENIEELEEFAYLGSKMTAYGSSEKEIGARLLKVLQAFATLRNIWKSGSNFQKTKIRLFKSNVLSILLCGSESWKMTKTTKNGGAIN